MNPITLDIDRIAEARRALNPFPPGAIAASPQAFTEAQRQTSAVYEGGRTLCFCGMMVYEMPRQQAPAYMIADPEIARRYLSGEIEESALPTQADEGVVKIRTE